MIFPIEGERSVGNQEMIHWWQGYVIIRISGKKLERLVNQMMNRRFAAWNIIRTTEEDAQLSIALKDFFKLRMLLKETGCRVHIVQKIGLPFLIRRMQHRIGLVVGAISFCILLYLFSMMIWTVEIEGVRLPEDEQLLREELRSMGVKPGSFKFLVDDPLEIKHKMMESITDVTWVGFQFQGTQAILKVVEKTIPELEEKTSPRHLVAKKKAIVYDLFVEQGQALVKPNQYVKPGDILVSGIIGSEDNQIIVSAKGKVLGEVWYETNISIPLKREKTVYTGEIAERFYLKVSSLPIKVWGFGEIPFEYFTRNQEEYKPEWRDWSIPITWAKETVRETEQVEETLTEEQAIQLAIQLSREDMRRNIHPNSEIKAENVLRKRIENGKVYIKMHYTVIEEIASEQLIIQGD